MGIETRKNGNSYYYRKIRRDGRVVSEYAGSGLFAQLSYRLDAIRRAERLAVEAERRAERQHRAQVERAENAGAWALLAEAQRYAALLLLASGLYYRHKGQWRKRGTPVIEGSQKRLKNRLLSIEEAARAELDRRKRAADLPPLPAPDDMSDTARAAILRRVDRTDATAEDVAALRRLMKHDPDVLGRIASPIRAALASALNSTHMTALHREAFSAQLDRQRAALGYAAAPELEQPLLDLVLLCQFRLMVVELEYDAIHGQGVSLQEADHYERKLSAVQRRYLAAVEALARVRRVRVELARITAPDGSTVEAAAIERPG
jgi:hypothetical protein